MVPQDSKNIALYVFVGNENICLAYRLISPFPAFSTDSPQFASRLEVVLFPTGERIPS